MKETQGAILWWTEAKKKEVQLSKDLLKVYLIKCNPLGNPFRFLAAKK